ncbi:hypothetical protein [Rubritalea tangerina]|uniref:hypothetical protein n=1 Tax=Rubritalea tangerina TaxID=430798 RepID=UPI003617DE26
MRTFTTMCLCAARRTSAVACYRSNIAENRFSAISPPSYHQTSLHSEGSNSPLDLGD